MTLSPSSPSTAADWQALGARLSLRADCFIDGRFVPAASGARFDCNSSIDGRTLTAVARGGKEDIDRAVAAARRSFEAGDWRSQPPRARGRVLRRLAELIETHADELALTETLDMGKPIADSLAIDVKLTARCIAFYGEAIDKQYDEVAPTASTSVAMIVREPLGVIGVVVPWNFPMMMAAWKLGPALATGNSVVLKPAEQSPLTALRLAELAAEAGLPDGVLNVVPGYGEEAGQALGRHMDVDAAAFTGSTDVGKLFLRYAGESNMKRVSLECGGKSPQIVLADAPNLDAAARSAALGIFFNQGEMCSAGSRLLVDARIKDDFLERVVSAGRAMPPGDPLDPNTRMGAILDRVQYDRVLTYMDGARRDGATPILEGGPVEVHDGGYYLAPTVFDAVTPDMQIAREEVFGPVLSVITVQDIDEAVRIANDTIYGLTASVWTRDINMALKTARALRAGVVSVNCYDDDDITTPFGGFKQSGFGRDRSLHALDKYTDLKTIWIELD